VNLLQLLVVIPTISLHEHGIHCEKEVVWVHIHIYIYIARWHITLSTVKTELVTEVNNIYMFACLNNSPEEKVKQMEKKVNELVEESCFANDRGEFPLVRKPISSRRLNIYNNLTLI